MCHLGFTYTWVVLRLRDKLFLQRNLLRSWLHQYLCIWPIVMVQKPGISWIYSTHGLSPFPYPPSIFLLCYPSHCISNTLSSPNIKCLKSSWSFLKPLLYLYCIFKPSLAPFLNFNRKCFYIHVTHLFVITRRTALHVRIILSIQMMGVMLSN